MRCAPSCGPLTPPQEDEMHHAPSCGPTTLTNNPPQVSHPIHRKTRCTTHHPVAPFPPPQPIGSTPLTFPLPQVSQFRKTRCLLHHPQPHLPLISNPGPRGYGFDIDLKQPISTTQPTFVWPNSRLLKLSWPTSGSARTQDMASAPSPHSPLSLTNAQIAARFFNPGEKLARILKEQ